MASPPPNEVYCGLMEQVKRRIELVDRFGTGALSVGAPDWDYECLSLQLRKTLELIAFGSLCANKTAYAAVHAKFEKHWNAKGLLRDLEVVHSQFYPQPVRWSDSQQTPGVKHLEAVATGFLTREEFVELYDTCSQVLHTPNPFDTRSSIDFRLTVTQWTARIRALLNFHLMQPAGTKEQWVITMQRPSDGKVQAAIARPTNE